MKAGAQSATAPQPTHTWSLVTPQDPFSRAMVAA